MVIHHCAARCMPPAAAMLVTAATVLAATTWNASAAYAWDEVSDDDGVKVYRRSASGSDVKEFKAISTIAAHVDTVMAVISDIDKYPRIMPPTAAVKLLSREGKELSQNKSF